MDRPVPEGVTVHTVPFSLMGVMHSLVEYKIGDWVNYGGMVYRPISSGSSTLVHTASGYGSTNSWMGTKEKHFAEIWNSSIFYCS